MALSNSEHFSKEIRSHWTESELNNRNVPQKSLYVKESNKKNPYYLSEWVKNKGTP
jgi:hypothetical protein